MNNPLFIHSERFYLAPTVDLAAGKALKMGGGNVESEKHSFLICG